MEIAQIKEVSSCLLSECKLHREKRQMKRVGRSATQNTTYQAVEARR